MTGRATPVSLGSLVVAMAGLLVAAQPEGLDAVRRDARAPWQAAFDRIVARHAAAPEIQAFTGRLAIIDRLARQMVASFEATRATALAGLIDDLLEADPAPPEPAPPTPVPSALQIFQEHQGTFEEALPRPALDDEALAALRGYYDASVNAAARYIAERGRAVAAASERSRIEVAELCVVVPLLHHTDEQWSAAQVRRLPSWLHQPAHLRTLEHFALRVHRPLTAWHLARGAAAGGPTDCVAYLMGAADRMVEANEAHAALGCLRAAVVAADAVSQPGAGRQARRRLADLYSRAGHPRLAAAEMQTLLDEVDRSAAAPPDPAPAGADARGRIALLRLEYLFAAGDFEAVRAEAPIHLADPRCAAYVPQLLFISWATHRRLGEQAQADAVRRRFLDRFPGHDLAVDFYYARARNALRERRYDEADRLLEIVEHRFPGSRHETRVRDMRSVLDGVLGDAE